MEDHADVFQVVLFFAYFPVVRKNWMRVLEEQEENLEQLVGLLPSLL